MVARGGILAAALLLCAATVDAKALLQLQDAPDSGGSSNGTAATSPASPALSPASAASPAASLSLGASPPASPAPAPSPASTSAAPAPPQTGRCAPVTVSVIAPQTNVQVQVPANCSELAAGSIGASLQLHELTANLQLQVSASIQLHELTDAGGM
ncbi:hypothetical protein OEZ85_010666 [Tetradesmus obliquus]|uniref:Pherophorin domain-containing protein n=1 Tax=Tetradesmus obliquus TaxID=3088 RepID=A0ABY8TQA7_TETOB|nr:hypothetical protein OEZ85_010666 [Tetradesmus obliquus]